MWSAVQVDGFTNDIAILKGEILPSSFIIPFEVWTEVGYKVAVPLPRKVN
jgi:hypothetical protein